FWSSPLPSAFARKMYAAPLPKENAGAPTRTSAYVSPLSLPTDTALPNWDPAVVWMIVRSGVFVPEPVRDDPLKRLIRPNVFGGAGGRDGDGDVRGRDGHGPGRPSVVDERGPAVLLADDRVVVPVVVEVPRRDAVSRAIKGRAVPLEVHARGRGVRRERAEVDVRDPRVDCVLVVQRRTREDIEVHVAVGVS